jgi:hypothetical protein
MPVRPEPSALLDLRRALRARIDAAGLAARRDVIERLAAPGVGLRTRDATPRDLAIGASRLGGDPDLPAGAPWPEGTEGPLLFVVQVDLAEIASFDLDGLLPSEGLLSLFVDRWGGEVHVSYAAPSAPFERFPVPSAVPRRFQPLGLDVFLELHLPQPGSPTIDAEEDTWTSDEGDAYWDELWLPWREEQRPGAAGTCGVHQLFGHAVPESESSVMAGELVLFGIDSDDRANMEWGDVHTLWVLISAADLAAQRWSRARATM